MDNVHYEKQYKAGEYAAAAIYKGRKYAVHDGTKT
jgi:hypothetical protein